MNRDDFEDRDVSRSDQQKPNKRPRIKKTPEPERDPYSERPLYRSDREDNPNEGWTRSYPDRPYSPDRERRSYSDSGERPRRIDWDSRGNRSEYGGRPDRSRTDYGSRPERSDRGQSDRPYRSSGGWGERSDRQSSGWGGGRDDRRGGGDRPYRDAGSRGGGYPKKNRFQRPGGGKGRPPFKRKLDTGHIRPEYPASLETVPEGPIRLNRYIASTGLCSRREADEFIKNGLITVNGVIVNELGSKVNYGDEILYNGRKLESEKKVYILLNKPKDYVTTVEDPNAKKTVMDLVKGACPERIYPVGRLDRMTTGVLLLTNDGDMTRKLTHPENEMKKIYHVQLDKELSATDFQTIMTGITLDDGFIRADSLDFTMDNDFTKVGIEIHTGRNRIVRRIFEHLGYKVQKLDRVYFAGLTKKSLKRGHWRFLSAKEVLYLKMSHQPA